MMNIFSVVLYVFICLLFVTTLLANLASSQVKRQSFFAVSLVVVALMAIFFLLARTNDYPSLLGIHFLAFGIFVPQLISRLIVQQRLKEPYFQLKINVLNPSCYQRKLMEQASTKRATFSSKPLAVTA